MSGEAAADQDSRDAIMRATYRALCEHGYAKLTMQDIADELDKSRSLLHYHYDTREDLLLAFVDNLVGWIDDRLEETAATDPRERLLAYVDQFMLDAGDDEHRDFLVALFQLRMQAVHNEQFREKLAHHYRKNVETAAEIIDNGVEQGVFHDVDPYETAETIYMAIEGARLYQVVLGAEGAARRMQDALLDYLVTDIVDTARLLDDDR
jgi:AcrR family transcriptional regulator